MAILMLKMDNEMACKVSRQMIRQLVRFPEVVPIWTRWHNSITEDCPTILPSYSITQH